MDDTTNGEMVLPISEAVRVSFEGVAIPEGFSVDPYHALDQIAAIQDEWGMDGNTRLPALRHCLAELTGVEDDQIASNQALDFETFIVAACGRLDEERKKKRESIACSPQSTPESHLTTWELGQARPKRPGSETHPTFSPTKSE